MKQIALFGIALVLVAGTAWAEAPQGDVRPVTIVRTGMEAGPETVTLSVHRTAGSIQEAAWTIGDTFAMSPQIRAVQLNTVTPWSRCACCSQQDCRDEAKLWCDSMQGDLDDHPRKFVRQDECKWDCTGTMFGEDVTIIMNCNPCDCGIGK